MLFRYLWPAEGSRPGQVTLLTATNREHALLRLEVDNAGTQLPAEGRLEIADDFLCHFSPSEDEDDGEDFTFSWNPEGFDDATLAEGGALPASLSEERFDPDEHWSDANNIFVETEEGLILQTDPTKKNIQ